jgi:predicted pyridoxine 5'-phosphate oxidase superfamily flavin-nucleotide-binding protein
MRTTTASDTADVGFHAGELAVQQRAGVRAEAARLSRMMEAGELRGGIAAFLATRTFAVITSRDASGRLWVSPLTGPAGFLHVTSPDLLTLRAALPPGDPLRGLPPGQQAGLVVVDFAARRRVRVNGRLTGPGDGTLAIAVQQAYGNCPQYITPRAVPPASPGAPDAGLVRRGATLTADDAGLVRAADTFFLGTSHPRRGSDASHRGGPPGFVRVDDGRLWWPDYPGNNMFNSMGNLAVDPAAALLFLDFATGRTLQLSGTAKVEWDVTGEDEQTGRRVAFTPQRLVARGALTRREDSPR